MEIGKDRAAELKRLFRIFKTVTQMMSDRGYFVTSDFRDMRFEEFEERFKDKDARQGMSMPYMKRENEQQKVYVFFSQTTAKFGKEDLKLKLNQMTDTGATSGIIILQGESNVNVADYEKEYKLEFFKEEELLVNITEHELVPQHLLITEEEKKELLKRYKLKEQQLPKILVTDPVARYYGLSRGDVVKIIRESETAGKYITYRYVS